MERGVVGRRTDLAFDRSAHIDDADMLLLCAFLFNDRVEPQVRIAPRLNHLDLGSNRIGNRGVAGMLTAASRAPRERLEALMLSSNEIDDEGAFELARAIQARVAFPNLRLLSMGGNVLSATGEAALRDGCGAAGVSVRGVGALRGAPLGEQWLARVAADPAAATTCTRSVSRVSEQDFARGVRARAVARGDPFISSTPRAI